MYEMLGVNKMMNKIVGNHWEPANYNHAGLVEIK